MTETTRRIESNKDLSPHLLRMMFDEPFFARILRGVNIEFGDDIPTAGVMVKDGDVHMICNPDFLSSLSDNHVKGLLKHECFHLAFEHCTSRRLEPHNIANIAADLAINSDIPSSELPDGGLVPGKMPDEPASPDGHGNTFADSPLAKLIASLPPHQSQEWYFTKIMQDEEAKKQAEGEGNGFDDHGAWGEMSDEEKDLVKGKMKEVLKQAVKDADRSGKWGSVGSSMRNKLREMVSNEVDWRSILKQFCGLSRRGTRTTTWSNINVVHIHPEHGPMSTGAKRGYTSSVAVYIDQSGSVGDDALALAFAELRNLARNTEFTTFHFDTIVDEDSEMVWKKRRTPAVHRTRCGGTDFQCVTEHANKNRKRFDGYIIITDGEASKPKASRLKRCWLLVPGTKLVFDSDKRDFVAKMKKSNKVN
tara:strand:- start:2717 stop:3976 length:1260 start_codon:yes stop_codon:yes gene_type:complete